MYIQLCLYALYSWDLITHRPTSATTMHFVHSGTVENAYLTMIGMKDIYLSSDNVSQIYSVCYNLHLCMYKYVENLVILGVGRLSKHKGSTTEPTTQHNQNFYVAC